jgi:site-specific DNA-cytosine methylase
MLALNALQSLRAVSRVEIMKGLKQRALQGHLVFRPPFGFKREIIERQDGHKRTRIISRAVIDEKNAAIVKLIFELFDQGKGYKAIVEILNDEGYRTERGLKFHVYHISKILRNRAYISEDNVRKYLQLVFDQNRPEQKPNAEERAITLAITDADTKLRRWEDALERGLLSIEDAAHRIKTLRHERAALLKTKDELARKFQSKGKILPIPTELMSEYIRQVQARLRANKIGHKKEFLREIIKEVRVRGREITLSYRIPLNPPKSPDGTTRGGFFTLSGMVVAVGLEPTTSRM